MKKKIKITIFFFIIILSFIIYQFFSNDINEYDLKESKTLNDKIIWSKNKKLKWSDFKYTPNKKTKIYTKVGISARYNTNTPIFFRSKTAFSPNESYVSDTSNLIYLRVAQTKFDLLEVYRLKMNKKVDSLKKLEYDNLEISDFENLTKHYYNNFKKEWESYKPINYKSLQIIEVKIKNDLKQFYSY